LKLIAEAFQLLPVAAAAFEEIDDFHAPEVRGQRSEVGSFHSSIDF
jgi:hypothetical protein